MLQNPEDPISVFEQQCGGKNLLLAMGPFNILKTYSKTEHEFYQWLNQKDSDQQRHKFRQVCPKYYGSTSIHPENIIIKAESEWTKHLIKQKYNLQQDKNHYLILQNLLQGMQKPSTLDLKIGIRSNNKPSNLKFIKSTTPTHNFRMCGVKVYQPKTSKVIFKDKYYHHTVGPDSIELNLGHFFFDGESINIPRVENAIVQLDKIIEAMNGMTGIKFESLSLFLAYDGHQEDNSITIKLIDFDCYIRQDCIDTDQNRIKGITNVRMYLQQIRVKYSQIVNQILARQDL